MTDHKALFANTGIQVPRLGLGCMGMSGVYGAGADEESTRTIHRALEVGCTFLDTADVYGAGHNEQLVGKALRGKRDLAFLATKFGLSGISNSAGEITVDGSPAYVQAACEKSLKRLGVESIDLYYLHRLDPRTPIEETVEAMAKLVQQGKVRFIGLSEISSTTLKKAHKIHPITAVQSEYSLWWTEPEQSILPTCRELGVAFVPYAPLGRGMLTGKLTSTEQLGENDWRRVSPRFQGATFDKNKALVDAVSVIAKAKGATVGQVALAWLLSEGRDIFPIPGTKRVSYLEENWNALDLTLSELERNELRSILRTHLPEGERYPEKALKLIDRR
ncbi:MAG: aldo/keto reductase [Oligoflexia bacterium]|nr:aldo/keto reductase [Oligoflexia bacterium]